MFSPFQAIVDWSFLEHLDTNNTITLYTDLTTTGWIIPNHVRIVHLDEIVDINKKGNKETIICMTMKLTHQDIIHIDEYDTRPKLWLSLHPGIMSIVHKYTAEDDDITRMLSHGYRVREPYDRWSFIDIIRQESGYGRIIDTFISDSINKEKKTESDYVIINNHWHYHDLVILIGGSSVASVTQSISLWGDEHKATLIAQWWWGVSIDDDEVVQHIKHASHIFIILEHKATESIRMYYDVLIKQYNSTIQISYIFPQYHLVTSILPDYIYELAGFDAERIAEYMTNE